MLGALRFGSDVPRRSVWRLGVQTHCGWGCWSVDLVWPALWEKRALWKHPLKTIFGLHICGLQRSSRKVHIILGPWSKLKSRKIYRWTGIAFWCTHFQPCPCYCRYLGTWAVSNDYTTFQSQDWIPNKTHIQKLSELALAIPTSRLILSHLHLLIDFSSPFCGRRPRGRPRKTNPCPTLTPSSRASYRGKVRYKGSWAVSGSIAGRGGAMWALVRITPGIVSGEFSWGSNPVRSKL
jgi:hypothetical protein